MDGQTTQAAAASAPRIRNRSPLRPPRRCSRRRWLATELTVVPQQRRLPTLEAAVGPDGLRRVEGLPGGRLHRVPAR
jgi:hypothetical protein